MEVVDAHRPAEVERESRGLSRRLTGGAERQQRESERQRRPLSRHSFSIIRGVRKPVVLITGAGGEIGHG